ncbi:MAG: hypothetical protein IPN32_25165 [Deltaproteobacteria bacterium]|nr:hypothetical protein [Deltaproteobacteria bacterium]
MRGERLERGGVLRRDREDVAVGRDRRVEVTELFLPQPRELTQGRQATLARGLDLESAAVDLGEVVPAVGRRIDRLERPDRSGVVGIERDDATVVALRVVGLGQLVAGDHRQLVEQHQALVIGDRRIGDALLEDAAQLVPAVGALGRRLEPAAQRGVGRPQAVGLGGPLQREGRRGQLVVRDLPQRLDQCKPLVVVGRGAQQHLVGPQQAGPVALLAVDRHQLARDLDVVGLDCERALERPDRPLGLAERTLAQLGHATVQRDAGLGRGQAIGGALQHLDQIVQPALRFVQLVQSIPRAVGHERIAEPPQRPLVSGLEAQQLGPHRHRVDAALQTVAVDAAERGQERGRGLDRRTRELAMQHLGGVVPARLAFVQSQQTRQRGRLIAVVLEHLAPRGDRLAAVTESLLGEVCELEAQRERGLTLALVEFLPTQRDEGPEIAPLLVDARQQAARALVARRQLQQRLQRLEGALGIAQLLEPDLGDLAQQLDLPRLVAGVLGRRDAPLVDPEQVIVATRLRVGLRERIEAGLMPRIDVENALQGRQRHGVELEAVAVLRGDLEQLVDARGVGGGTLAEALALFLEQLDQRGPLAAVTVEPLERGRGPRIVAVLAQHRAPGLDRAIDPARLRLGQRRDLLRQREAGLGVLAGPPGLHEHLDQLCHARLAGELLAIERQHLGVGRLRATHATEVRLGERGLPGASPQQRAGDQRDVVARVVAGGSGRDRLGGVLQLGGVDAVDDHATEQSRGREP